MAFDGKEGGEISLQSGGEMTALYRLNNPNQLLGHFFGEEILNQLLSQEGCVGIRMYYAENEDGEKQLVLVGADADQNDLLELVVDLSSPCPNWCSSRNPLNS